MKGSVTVGGSTITNNVVNAANSGNGGDAFGGAIDAELGAVTISKDSHLDSNSVNAGDGRFGGDGGDAFGGGVFARDGNLTLHSSSVSTNKVVSGRGADGFGAGGRWHRPGRRHLDG